MPVPSLKVGSVTEFAQHVLADFAAHRRSFVYRGVPAANYPLANTLQRRVLAEGGSTDEDFRRLETQILTEFARRAQGFGYSRSMGLGHLIALAQHHGLPTRFLDWTSSGLTALHFALQGAAGDAAVWRLDWTQMHRLYEPRGRRSIRALDIEDINQLDRREGQQGYDIGSVIERFRDADLSQDPAKPHEYAALVTIPFLHPRIAAQQGAFVVWTEPMSPLEEFLKRHHPANKLLTKLVIPKSAVKKMRAELRHLGITETLLWPDLDGAARDSTAAVFTKLPEP